MSDEYYDQKIPYPEYANIDANSANAEIAALEAKRNGLTLRPGLSAESAETKAYKATIASIINRQVWLRFRAEVARRETVSTGARPVSKTSTISTALPTSLAPITTPQLPPTRQQRGEPAQPTTTRTASGAVTDTPIVASVPVTDTATGAGDGVITTGAADGTGSTGSTGATGATGVSGAGTTGSTAAKPKVGKKGAPAKVAFGAEYEQRVKTQYPQYAWMLTDLDRTKYSDLFQLLDEATRNPLVPMPDELFDRKFVATSWATELAAGSLGRDVVKTVGNLSWGSGQLGKFLTQAGRFGWTGDNLGFEAYKAIFSKKADGTFENPNAIGEVKASTPFQQLKRIGTDYLSPLDDEQVAASLSGGDTYDDTLRKTRELAKVQYPHLAAAIDAGVTLANISFGYKRQAAEILELDPNTIDMSSAKYNMALKSGEGGKERMMGTGEWAAMLKSDASFGYQFTKTANKDALDLGTTIARAFGKVQ